MSLKVPVLDEDGFEVLLDAGPGRGPARWPSVTQADPVPLALAYSGAPAASWPRIPT